MLQQAPLVRTRSKVRHHEPDVARALVKAMDLWTLPIWMPVVFNGKLIGAVNRQADRCYYTTGQFPYSSYDVAVTNKSAGKHWAQYWYKPVDSGSAIGNWYDLWGTVGNPQAGDWSGAALTARQFVGTTPGASYTGGVVGPAVKCLTRTSCFEAEGALRTLLLYDRVLSYDKCTMSTSSLSMVNTLAATRYISAGDPGLQIFVEADTVHSAVAADLTVLTYTNSAGVASKTVLTTPTLSKILSIAAPTTTLGARSVIQAPGITTKSVQYLPLAVADLGVRSIQNFTWSAAPTGTCAFVLQFPLAIFVDGVTNTECSDVEMLFGFDAIAKQVYDDACLSWMYYGNQTATPSPLHMWTEFGW